MEAVNVSEAKSRFLEYLSRAAAGERIGIRRGNRNLAALISVEELERLEQGGRTSRHLAEALGQQMALLERLEKKEVHPAMAAFGLWADEPDLATLADEIVANREGQPFRDEPARKPVRQRSLHCRATGE